MAKNNEAKLVEVANPAKLTNAKIQEISKDDGTDNPENSANKDVAEQLKQSRADAKATAKSDDTNTPRDLPGAGGARG